MHRKSLISFRFLYLHLSDLTLAHCIGQSEDHTNFDCDYLVNSNSYNKIIIAHTYEVAHSLSIGKFKFDLVPSLRSRSITIRLWKIQQLSHTAFRHMSTSTLPILVLSILHFNLHQQTWLTDHLGDHLSMSIHLQMVSLILHFFNPFVVILFSIIQILCQHFLSLSKQLQTLVKLISSWSLI